VQRWISWGCFSSWASWNSWGGVGCVGGVVGGAVAVSVVIDGGARAGASVMGVSVSRSVVVVVVVAVVGGGWGGFGGLSWMQLRAAEQVCVVSRWAV
jgi:hypothetical protein